MLTNIHYYNNYRNSVLNNKGSRNQKKQAEKFLNNLSTENTKSSDKSILMNKAYNPKVISYISDIASTVNELKTSTNSIIKEFKSINKSFKYKGETETFNIIKDELDDFIDAYNTSTDIFNKNVKESNYLKDYYSDIKGTLNKNVAQLNNIGVKLDENNKLTFDEEEFDNISLSDKVDSLKNVRGIFENLNEETNEVLKVPLSKHLQFKSFNYYFNYKINTTYNDTFKLVETGTLIDIAV